LAKLLPKFLLLPGIALPHRYDVLVLAARGPDHHHHPSAQQPERLVAVLAVILPQVLSGPHGANEHLGCILEIETPLLQRFGPLRRIIGDWHVLM
jgi:hypothetical protein